MEMRIGTAARAALPLALGAALWLAGCGVVPLGHKPGETQETSAQAPAPAVPSRADRFEAPGEMDRMLDAKPIALPAVKSAASGASITTTAAKTGGADATAPGKGRFRIQVGAESDFDAAQAKKKEYEKLLGGVIDVVFDAPYYKLRWGYFETKQDAEDKILEMSDQNIQGFVIKQ